VSLQGDHLIQGRRLRSSRPVGQGVPGPGPDSDIAGMFQGGAAIGSESAAALTSPPE